MIHQVDTNQARRHLRDLIDAALRGEVVLIEGEDKKIVQLVPVDEPRPTPKFGSAKGMIQMSEDFDEPLSDFDEYRS